MLLPIQRSHWWIFAPSETAPRAKDGGLIPGRSPQCHMLKPAMPGSDTASTTQRFRAQRGRTNKKEMTLYTDDSVGADSRGELKVENNYRQKSNHQPPQISPTTTTPPTQSKLVAHIPRTASTCPPATVAMPHNVYRWHTMTCSHGEIIEYATHKHNIKIIATMETTVGNSRIAPVAVNKGLTTCLCMPRPVSRLPLARHCRCSLP